MAWFIFGLVLLGLNLWFGIRDVKSFETTKSAAFTWFVIGFLAFDLFLFQLPKLLIGI